MKAKKKTTSAFTLHFDARVKVGVNYAARKQGRSMTNFINQALSQHPDVKEGLAALATQVSQGIQTSRG